MNPHETSLREIVRGLEGLEMLGEWELSLAHDLRAKAEEALRLASAEEPPAGDRPNVS
jgi:hypothetical protein